MKIIPIIDVRVQIELTYEQAKALDAMAGYGSQAFIKAFKEKLGSSYIEPYENGITSLFAEIRGNQRPIQKAIKMREDYVKALSELNNNKG